MKKKTEVALICDLPLERPREIDIKSYLEKAVNGLSISAVSKKADKFMVTSNLYSILTSHSASRASAKDGEIYKLKTENAVLQERIHELEEKFAATTQIKEHLAKDCDSLKAKNLELDSLNKGLQESLTVAQQLTLEKEKTLEIISGTNKSLAETVSGLEAEKNSLIDDVQKLCEKLLEHEKEFNVIVEHTQKLEGENVTLSEEVKDYEGHIHELKNKMSSMQSRKSIEPAGESDLIKNEALLRKRIKELEDLLKECKENEALGKRKLREMQIETQESEEKLRAIRREVHEKEEAHKELEENINNLEHDYLLAENQIEILQMKLEENEKQIATLRRQIQTLDKSQRSYESQSLAAKQKLEILELELKKKEREAKVREDQVKVLTQNWNEKIKMLKSQLTESDKIIAGKENELKELRDQIAGNTKEPSNAKEKIKDLIVELTQSREEFVVRANEILALRDEVTEKELKIKELCSKLDEKAEMLSKTQHVFSEQEKELTSVKNRLKEFESLSDNLEVLEKTRKQLEDLQTDYAKLKKSAEESIMLGEQLEEVKKQKDRILKEFTTLKAYVFENEQKLMNYEKGNEKMPASPGKHKYKVLEEIKLTFCDILSLCKAMDTMAKEMMVIYEEKRDKVNEYIKFLPEYVKTKNKEERLNMAQVLGNSFPFLNCIPKKLINMSVIDDCVITILKAKQQKLNYYDDCICKYEKLINVAVNKFAEYDQKLSCY